MRLITARCHKSVYKRLDFFATYSVTCTESRLGMYTHSSVLYTLRLVVEAKFFCYFKENSTSQKKLRKLVKFMSSHRKYSSCAPFQKS